MRLVRRAIPASAELLVNNEVVFCWDCIYLSKDQTTMGLLSKPADAAVGDLDVGDRIDSRVPIGR